MKLRHLLLIVLVVFAFAACQNKKIDSTDHSTGQMQSIYFDYDQSLIRSDSVSAMQGNAAYIKSSTKGTVTVEGNCDNRGTNEYNLALGQRRAEASKNYIVNLGVSSSNLRAVSFGEEKPVCYTSDESCWQKNRRADFRK